MLRRCGALARRQCAARSRSVEAIRTTAETRCTWRMPFATPSFRASSKTFRGQPVQRTLGSAKKSATSSTTLVIAAAHAITATSSRPLNRPDGNERMMNPKPTR